MGTSSGCVSADGWSIETSSCSASSGAFSSGAASPAPPRLARVVRDRFAFRFRGVVFAAGAVDFLFLMLGRGLAISRHQQRLVRRKQKGKYS